MNKHTRRGFFACTGAALGALAIHPTSLLGPAEAIPDSLTLKIKGDFTEYEAALKSLENTTGFDTFGNHNGPGHDLLCARDCALTKRFGAKARVFQAGQDVSNLAFVACLPCGYTGQYIKDENGRPIRKSGVTLSRVCWGEIEIRRSIGPDQWAVLWPSIPEQLRRLNSQPDYRAEAEKILRDLAMGGPVSVW